MNLGGRQGLGQVANKDPEQKEQRLRDSRECVMAERAACGEKDDKQGRQDHMKKGLLSRE